MESLIAIGQVAFADPEEGATATIDRLALAVTRHRVSPGALQSLVLLTSLACHPESGVMPCVEAEIRELKRLGLIRWAGQGRIELI